MIVDCHTQIWDEPAVEDFSVEPGSEIETRHIAAVDPVDCAFVLGFKSNYLGREISNDLVAKYVRRHAGKLIGVAGLDPTDDDCLDQVSKIRDDIQFQAVTISPALQNYHPSDGRAMRFYEACATHGLPLIFEQSSCNTAAKLEFAKPVLLDEVAREFPTLRIVISQMGFPWVNETVVLLAKHEHVYADVSGLLSQRWICYNALLTSLEYGVINKLLFGSDFPNLSPAEGIEALYSINQLSIGSNLVAIPREKLRGIVERDTLSLLGMDAGGPRITRQATILDDEEI